MKKTSERREKILSLLRDNGSVQGIELANLCNVSTVTIRNDLDFFEKQHIATRTYGGAYLNKNHSDSMIETPSNDKSVLNLDINDKIAKVAAQLVNNGDTLILDAGTITQRIANYLVEHQNITVMTNGLNVANTLATSHYVKVMITGGMLHHESRSFYGSQAEQSLENYHFDKLFIGVDGFDLRRGITTDNENEARLNKYMCKVADEVIVVADSAKFSKVSLHHMIDLGKVNRVITDSNIPEHYLTGLEEMGIKVTLID